MKISRLHSHNISQKSEDCQYVTIEEENVKYFIQTVHLSILKIFSNTRHIVLTSTTVRRQGLVHGNFSKLYDLNMEKMLHVFP